MAAGGYSTHHPEALAQHPQRSKQAAPEGFEHSALTRQAIQGLLLTDFECCFFLVFLLTRRC